MDEATRFQRLSLMYGGQVLAAGEPDEIRQQASGSLVELSVEPQVAALDRLKTQFPQVEAVGPRLRVFIDDQSSDAASSVVSDLLSGLAVTEIQATVPELEDAFVALLRQRKLTEQESVSSVITNQAVDQSNGNAIAIEARGLTRDFDSFRAVDHASFTVRHGEIFGLLGANGAGKTTVIKMLTGILPPTEGEGQVAGADMRRATQTIKERIGYISQAFSLYQDMTVMENIRLYARISMPAFMVWVVRSLGNGSSG
jgi:ABC-2 type transport system ATP-binding protein